MKKFDWESPRFKERNPQGQLWLRNNYNKRISETQFVVKMQHIRKFGKKQNNYKPSRLKIQYWFLRDNFGFFVGEKVSLLD